MKKPCCNSDCEQGRTCPDRLDYTLRHFVIVVALLVALGLSLFVGSALANTANTVLVAEEQAQAWREGW